MRHETRRLILLLLPAGIVFAAFFLLPMARLFFIGGSGKTGWAAYAAIGAFSHAWVAEHVPVEAWYLSILGVSPERHGSGLGSQLVRAGLRRVDVGRRPAYVETFNPRSVPFYERHGFATVATGHESTTGRPFWLLLRPGRDKA